MTCILIKKGSEHLPGRQASLNPPTEPAGEPASSANSVRASSLQRLGRVGLSEAEAYQRYGEGARVSLLALADTDTDRGRVAGETTGFIKLIAAPRPVLKGTLFLQVVGMTAVAPAGGELIVEAHHSGARRA